MKTVIIILVVIALAFLAINFLPVGGIINSVLSMLPIQIERGPAAPVTSPETFVIPGTEGQAPSGVPGVEQPAAPLAEQPVAVAPTPLPQPQVQPAPVAPSAPRQQVSVAQRIENTGRDITDTGDAFFGVFRSWEQNATSTRSVAPITGLAQLMSIGLICGIPIIGIGVLLWKVVNWGGKSGINTTVGTAKTYLPPQWRGLALWVNIAGVLILLGNFLINTNLGQSFRFPPTSATGAAMVQGGLSVGVPLLVLVLVEIAKKMGAIDLGVVAIDVGTLVRLFLILGVLAIFAPNLGSINLPGLLQYLKVVMSVPQQMFSSVASATSTSATAAAAATLLFLVAGLMR